MPEGPSIVILKELVTQSIGKEIIEVSGNTTIDKERLLHKVVRDFKSWGKHFLIVFDDFSIRIHFLLFGTYRINERKDSKVRLGMLFNNGELNLYTCGVQLIEENLDYLYNWSADIMSPEWDPFKARQKLISEPDMLACDALLNQNIFSGSGNIIKNEVLFRIAVHPESKIGKLPEAKLAELISETRNYSFDFLRWKKAYELKKHWLAHTKKICPVCNLMLTKKHTGKTNRRSFYCENCQVLYA